tara:strand:- start:2075 stop:2455 length:381 start_codon:yes stop_codon:yes gene_type:complete
MKSRLEIIKETVEFYTTEQNKRSIAEDGACIYNSENGSHCAVGRCFSDDYKNEGVKFKFNRETGVADLDNAGDGLDRFLAKEYRGHSVHFWSSLQKLHDELKYWEDEFTLSPSGKGYVESILNENQ